MIEIRDGERPRLHPDGKHLRRIERAIAAAQEHRDLVDARVGDDEILLTVLLSKFTAAISGR